MTELDGRLELAEYQIRERIEEKLWKRIMRWGIIIGGVITLITAIGIPSVISSISKSITDKIRIEIKQETSILSNKLAKDLAELAVITATLDADAKRAKTTVGQYEIYTKELRSLKLELTKLSEEAVEVRETAKQAIASARAALQDTKKLRSSLADSSAGKPVILGWSAGNRTVSNDFEIPIDGYFIGSNFGNETGRVFSIVKVFPDSFPNLGMPYSEIISSDLIPLEETSIISWTNTKVEIEFSKGDQKRLSNALDTLGRSASRYASISFVVETLDGSRSSIPESAPE